MPRSSGSDKGETDTDAPPAIVSFRGGELLPRLSARGETTGPVARRDLARYYELLDEYIGRLGFAEPEARLLYDAASDLLDRLDHAGSGILPAHRWLWAEVADAIRDRDLDKKYGIEEPQALVDRVRGLEPAESRALLDALERYHTARARGEGDSSELLARVGLIHQ